MSEGKRSLPGWLLPTGLGILVVVLVIVALNRGPVTLDPGSPEGTVQEYLLAINEERWDDAVAVIHPEWLGGCVGDDLADFNPGDFSAELGTGAFGGGLMSERFAEIGEVEGEQLPSGTEFVEVTISHNTGGGLGSSWEEFATFEMIDEDDFWWIAGDPWPYFIWSCRNQ